MYLLSTSTYGTQVDFFGSTLQKVENFKTTTFYKVECLANTCTFYKVTKSSTFDNTVFRHVFPANHLAMVLTKQTYNTQDKHKKPPNN